MARAKESFETGETAPVEPIADGTSVETEPTEPVVMASVAPNGEDLDPDYFVRGKTTHSTTALEYARQFAVFDSAAPTLGAAFAGIAGRTITFGCGRWPYVPFTFDRDASGPGVLVNLVNSHMTTLASMAGAKVKDDTSLPDVCAKVAQELKASAYPTLDELAVDLVLREYVTASPSKLALADGEKKLKLDGFTTAESRARVVRNILDRGAVDLVASTPVGNAAGRMCRHLGYPVGTLWTTVIQDAIVRLVSEVRPTNARKSDTKTAAGTPSGRRGTSEENLEDGI